MAQMVHTIQCRIDVDGLLAQIERLAAHVDAAPADDPVRLLAAKIGEIDADTDIKRTTIKEGDTVAVTFEAHGNLARLLLELEVTESNKNFAKLNWMKRLYYRHPSVCVSRFNWLPYGLQYWSHTPDGWRLLVYEWKCKPMLWLARKMWDRK